MIIDLTSPLWGSIAAGIILMIIGGTYHYSKMLVTLNITNKQLSNILSELDLLQKNYKETTSKIHEDRNTFVSREVELPRDNYVKKIDELLIQTKDLNWRTKEINRRTKNKLTNILSKWAEK